MDETLQVRAYGTDGPTVVVVHGGPGDAGSMAPVARELARGARVIEPWQRRSGGEPLTVARHVADLQAVLEDHCGDTRPVMVGHSWGAMLALAHAAAHPDSLSSLVLVGCGTFDTEARAVFYQALDDRTDEELKGKLEDLANQEIEPGERVWQTYQLTKPLYLFDPIAGDDTEREPFDFRGFEETWSDMLRLQDDGTYPAAFSAIDLPVLMLHGTYDPHPGDMIRAALTERLANLESIEIDKCGHEPWLEKQAADAFHEHLRRWIAEHTR